MGEEMGRCMDGWMDENWMDEMSGWIDGQMDIWMDDGWADGRVGGSIYPLSLTQSTLRILILN